LLGKNGAGKTTLLRLIAGLLNPQTGTLSVMDFKPSQRKPAFLQEVYFVPEEFYTPSTSIKNYVKAAAPLYPSFDFSKMDVILKDFELDTNKNLDKMSYGQKKKFLIAFALSTNCKLLVLDEPTNGLDIPSKTLFRKVMAGALSEDQLVIISTHQVKDVEMLIDRIILIDHGQVMFNNTVFNITQNFAFYTVSDISKVNCLYHEKSPGGYNVIINKNGTETPLDIELLFNAIINGTKLTIHESDI
jgi:ABC-2 type transport system ATP-binding protein